MTSRNQNREYFDTHLEIRHNEHTSSEDDKSSYKRLKGNPRIKLFWMLLHLQLAIMLSSLLQIEIFQICPKLLNQEFDVLPSDEEIVSFIKELGHKGYIKSITEVVVDQIRDSPAYKTYLAFATGATSPKKARKYKKPASPLRKRTLVTVEEEEPEPTKKVLPSKKPSRKQSSAALLEEAQMKKALKRSQQETTIHQVGGSGDGTGSKPGVPDEPKGKSGDSGDEANVQETNDDDEEFDDDFIHTPPNYYHQLRMKRMMNPIRLTDAEQDDEEKEDADMIDAAHVQFVVQATTTATPAIQNATTEVPLFSSSHSVSSNYTSAFLNLENLQSTKTEVVSMLDINVQHEVPRTLPLLTIPISIILEHTIFNPSDTVTTALVTTITSLLSSLFPNLHQSTPIRTPTNTEATTSTPSVLESETLNAIHLRLSDLEKELKDLNNVDHSSTLLSKIKFEVPNAIKHYLGTSLDDALYKVLKKHDVGIIKELSVPAEIVERLTQQYLPQESNEKSIKDIYKIKMEHASKQQVPKFTINDEVFSTRMAFRGNTRDFGSFGEEMDKTTTLHQIHKARVISLG
ncbi:hypothetical protein Tco_0840218 [Tanacetum coccineum]|uniref:Uncharacterized protein n=1 Tax=Tanacetum coccineum TaxID=301880 RepID=A0ABQ5AU34_9ASTR